MSELVWFKRDLRIADHAPLTEALRHGPVLGVYLYEPSIMGADDFSVRHLTFINESLDVLREDFRTRGGRLVTRIGEAVEVFDALYRAGAFKRIWAHEETGNGRTYARDRAVLAWAAANGVEVIELPQFGVVRRLKSRDGWASRWARFMSQPTVPAPDAIRTDGTAEIDDAGLCTPDFVRHGRTLRNEQAGGSLEGQRVMREFLRERGRGYRGGISSPNSAWSACGRISPYLAWGNLSMRQVYQTTLRRRQSLGPGDAAWRGSLDDFLSRLSWHCHFIQKLEDEPRIEFENMHPAYDGLREPEFDPAYFDAWASGQTGYPLIDACMRAVTATGWLNFRMRAMLVSFAAYHLWLHWRAPALHLARLFTDYEPGIHYSQFQMQSGTTGMNTLRIYSPAKQVADQDPDGTFIRQWVPELQAVPDEFIGEPHKLGPLHQQAIGVRIGKDYPAPIVEHGAAVAAAKARIGQVRSSARARALTPDVVRRHGSRKRPMTSRGRRF